MVPIMERGIVHIYTGDGRGKSPAALGRAVQAAAAGEQVVIIQFLKGKGLEDTEFVRRLEPEIKLFRFEKSDEFYEELPEEKKAEEDMNIRNGIPNLCRRHCSYHRPPCQEGAHREEYLPQSSFPLSARCI
mgnify:CR=1 FL=1